MDWPFVSYWVLSGLFIGCGLLSACVLGLHYANHPEHLFGDASLYFRATEAGLSGGDPWAVRGVSGVQFAGLPTTLLLNLPLIPFGPDAARVFWPVAGLVGWLVVMRRAGLAPWWILFPPFVEGWLPGSPDPALAGLILVGGGAVAAVTKPYSVPALLADRRWLALGAGAGILATTALLLPWGRFLGGIDVVTATLDAQALRLSAWGNPPLMLASGLALIALGPRLGLRLATPVLSPSSQLHYSIFSAEAGAKSAFLALALAVPGAAPYGVVAYAVGTRLLPRIRARRGRTDSTWLTIPPDDGDEPWGKSS